MNYIYRYSSDADIEMKVKGLTMGVKDLQVMIKRKFKQ
jgi:hypothetical protein